MIFFNPKTVISNTAHPVNQLYQELTAVSPYMDKWPSELLANPIRLCIRLVSSASATPLEFIPRGPKVTSNYAGD